MRDFVIMTDSSCDLPIEFVEQYDIMVTPMNMTFDGNAYQHYYDYRELHVRDFYDGMRNGKIGSTAGTNLQDAVDMMRPVVEGGKDIIYLALSSGLSCSYQNACLAAEELLEEYEDTRISVIDTKSVSLGVGMMAYIAAQRRANGHDYDQIVEYLNTTCDKVCHYFSVDDLSHLQRGGRISHLTSVVGTIIGIKPIFTIDAEGKIQNEGKARGRKASLRYITDHAKDRCVDHTIFAICHADAPEDAEMIKNNILEANPDANIIVGDIGPIIGLHTGVGTLAVICLGGDR